MHSNKVLLMVQKPWLFYLHASLRSFLGNKHVVGEVGVGSHERDLRTMDLGAMEEEERRI